jgi:hypothetical protein
MISLALVFVAVVILIVYFNINPAVQTWHIVERLGAICLIVAAFIVGSLTASDSYTNSDNTLEFVKNCTDMSGLAKYVEVDDKAGVACIENK